MRIIIRLESSSMNHIQSITLNRLQVKKMEATHTIVEQHARHIKQQSKELVLGQIESAMNQVKDTWEADINEVKLGSIGSWSQRYPLSPFEFFTMSRFQKADRDGSGWLLGWRCLPLESSQSSTGPWRSVRCAASLAS